LNKINCFIIAEAKKQAKKLKMYNKRPESLVLYHIQILKEGRDEWFAKQTYTVGSGMNHYYQGMLESLGKDKSLLAANMEFLREPIDQIIDCSTSDPKDKAFDEMCKHRNLCREKLIETTLGFGKYLKWINEEILENIRVNEFPHLPSRKRCLWLSDYNSLSVWKDMLAKSQRIKILKVEATGKFHPADGGWISAGAYSIVEFQNNARNYWSGELCESPEPEFLFEGEVTVLSEHNTFDDIT
jgi:hypothetical protein